MKNFLLTAFIFVIAAMQVKAEIAPPSNFSVTGHSQNSINFNITGNSTGDNVIVISCIRADMYGIGEHNPLSGALNAGDSTGLGSCVEYKGTAGNFTINYPPGTGKIHMAYSVSASNEYSAEGAQINGAYTTYIVPFTPNLLALGYDPNDYVGGWNSGNGMIWQTGRFQGNLNSSNSPGWVKFPEVIVGNGVTTLNLDLMCAIPSYGPFVDPYTMFIENHDSIYMEVSNGTSTVHKMIMDETNYIASIEYLPKLVSFDEFKNESVIITLYFAIHNSTNVSVRIQNLNLTTEEETGCPRPNNLAANDITNNSATITWGLVEEGDVLSYELGYCKTGFTEWEVIKDITQQEYTLTALSASQSYQVRIQSVCGEGLTSSFSSVLSFVTTAGPVCKAPTNLTATDIDDHSATIQWNSSDNNTSWVVQYRESASTNYITLNKDEPSAMLTDLLINTSYTWRVKAICDEIGESSYVGSSFNTTGVGIDENSKDFKIYATNGQIHIINTSSIHIDGIEIFNILGQKVGNYNSASSDHVLINTTLESGIYLVSVYFNNTRKTEKVLIK